MKKKFIQNQSEKRKDKQWEYKIGCSMKTMKAEFDSIEEIIKFKTKQIKKKKVHTKERSSN